MILSHLEFRKVWREYMESKGHQLIPSLPLPSYSDPTLLFVNSGMFPLVPYFESQHPQGKRVYNTQRCLRPMEFDEIGDNRHTSVFEMIGNWSFGDYFKKEQLTQLYTFLIEKLHIEPSRLYASVYAGDELVERDNESIEILQEIFTSYGLSCEVAPAHVDGKQEIDLDKYRIFPYGKEHNWWKRGDAVGELGGPDSEVFYDLQIEHDAKKWGYAHPATDSGRFVEIGNSVFMQYRKTETGWEQLKQKNVDYGGGLERLVMVAQHKTDIFSTDLYENSIKAMEELFKVKYNPVGESKETKAFRIIADHFKAAVFMAGDDVIPANKEQGYVLRRAIRRAVKFAYLTFGVKTSFSKTISVAIIDTYKDVYPHLKEHEEKIIDVICTEENKFWKTFVKGMDILMPYLKSDKPLDGSLGFTLYETYGIPFEVSLELFYEHNKKVSETFTKDFETAQSKHRELSRAGAQQRFKGGLADTQEITVRYHTCAHLMLASMQKVLGPDVHQKGQNITDQRLRYDINFPRPLTQTELKEIEDLVNAEINKGLEISIEQIKKDEIRTKGAEGSFMDRYGEIVNVYRMEDPVTHEIFSYEVCGGPHVTNTKEILQSGKLKIIKEESSGAGIRRLKAIFVK
jgi:alanyl-tRNA synthetase